MLQSFQNSGFPPEVALGLTLCMLIIIGFGTLVFGILFLIPELLISSDADDPIFLMVGGAIFMWVFTAISIIGCVIVGYALNYVFKKRKGDKDYHLLNDDNAT
eukprot:TRINITY_DN18593_c0_g1_i1.p1 TRINITY_DN18593_c0_g1~~TRINITY_DN18593_c0_g1_i1.p1  ORF type:complete len:103 (-),score=6.56 TRINITY_DN18593_c0_g1_i1:19-327(-)